MTHLHIPSPKRDATARKGWNGFFPYYAGFSERFAIEVIKRVKLAAGARILDPWNGSGTTTFAASSLGYEAVGCDLNPVMVIIARARLLAATNADDLLPIAREIISSSKRSRLRVKDNDPLLHWFSESAVKGIRSIEISIRRHPIAIETQGFDWSSALQNMSDLAATMYVALFSVSRSAYADLKTSNPTWIRKRLPDDAKVTLSAQDISDRFIESVREMTLALHARGASFSFDHASECSLRVGSTFDSTIYDDIGEFDLILTSPPYCTRIDYTASTRVELAILSPWTGISIDALSREMVGTVKVPAQPPMVSDKWGSECISFLDAVRCHPSKSSSGYYYKNHVDYFDKLYKSLLLSVDQLASGGKAVFIIQDSFYKDVHNDLPKILTEMLSEMDVYLTDRYDFSSKRAMSGINKNHLTYKRYNNPTEAVLMFEKGR